MRIELSDTRYKRELGGIVLPASCLLEICASENETFKALGTFLTTNKLVTRAATVYLLNKLVGDEKGKEKSPLIRTENECTQNQVDELVAKICAAIPLLKDRRGFLSSHEVIHELLEGGKVSEDIESLTRFVTDLQVYEAGQLFVSSQILLGQVTAIQVLIACRIELYDLPAAAALHSLVGIEGFPDVQLVAASICNMLADSKFRTKQRTVTESLGKSVCAVVFELVRASKLAKEIEDFSRGLLRMKVSHVQIMGAEGVASAQEKIVTCCNVLGGVLGFFLGVGKSSKVDGVDDLGRRIISTTSLLAERDARNYSDLLSTRGAKRVGTHVAYSPGVREVLESRFEPVGEDGDYNPLSYKNNLLRLICDETNPEFHGHFGMNRAGLSEILNPRGSGTKVKTAKGAIDLHPTSMLLRERVLDLIKKQYSRCGAVQIDTPIFELHETMMGKYGEDTKLIYQLQDQGGEKLSLRYDLTVPLARYCASNKVESLKRFHIGKVYRRDEPQVNKGRFREFYQCDLDIAGGNHDLMVPETECLYAFTKILLMFSGVLGEFEVVVSHRGLLDGMMSYCGVDEDKHRSICAAIDKLDKLEWEQVRAEMVEQKGLDPSVADKIRKFIEIDEPLYETISALRKRVPELLENSSAAMKAAEELSLLGEMLQSCGIAKHFRFNMSLARGLDYYTGVIYEARLKNGRSGSIGAGGRYDGLIGNFMGKVVPAVGVSLGIERIFRMLEEELGVIDCDTRGRGRGAKPTGIAALRGCPLDVYLCATTSMTKRLTFVNKLREAGFATEYATRMSVRLPKQLQVALERMATCVVIIGEDEDRDGMCKLKPLAYEGEKPQDEITLPIGELIGKLRDIIPVSGSRLQDILSAKGLK